MGVARTDHEAVSRSRHAGLQHAVRQHRRRVSRIARRALLQDRVVREHRSSAHSRRGGNGQTSHHLDRHGEVAELDETVRTARDAGCDDLILLKCTSTYPASPENTNLRTIPHLREMFGVQVGLSDHTMGVGASVAAVAMGATLDRKALHAVSRRWWRGFRVFGRTPRARVTGSRDRARLAGTGRCNLRSHGGGKEVPAVSSFALRRHGI